MTLSDSLKDTFLTAKLLVKGWEGTYKKLHGSKPNKEALSTAPDDIRNAYKLYWKYQKALSVSKLSSPHSNIEEVRNISSEDTNTGLCLSTKFSSSNEECKTNEADLPVLHVKNDKICSQGYDQMPHSISNVTKDIWGSHLNKANSSTILRRTISTESSLYFQMAEKMKSNAVVKTRMSLKRLPSCGKAKLSNIGSVIPSTCNKEKLLCDSNASFGDDSFKNSDENLTFNDSNGDHHLNSCDSLDRNKILKNSCLDDISLQNDDKLNKSYNSDIFPLGANKCITKKNHLVSNSQSISLLSLSSPTKNSVSNVRKVDRNWLRRCSQLNIISNLDVDDIKDELLHVQNEKENSDLKINQERLNTFIESPTSSSVPDCNPVFQCSSNKSSSTHYRSTENHSVVLQEENLKKNEPDKSVTKINKNKDIKACNLSSQKRKFNEITPGVSSSKKFKSSEAISISDIVNKSADSDNDAYIYTSDDESKSANMFSHISLNNGDDVKCQSQVKLKNKKQKNLSLDNKVQDFKSSSSQPEYDELLDMENKSQTISNPTTGKIKILTKEEKLQKKVSTGKLNDNFVKINLKKKIFVRGQKRLTCEKYKRQEWKKKKVMKRAEDGGEGSIKKLTCFRCGEFGHWANKCPGKIGDSLMAIGDYNENDSIFLSLDEAADLAKGIKSSGQNVTSKAYASTSEDTTVREPLPECFNESDDDLFDDIDLDISAYKDIIHSAIPDGKMNIGLPCQNKNLEQELTLPAVPAIYAWNKDKNLSVPSEVYKTLKLFGYESFRKGQEETIMRILSGQSTLLILSTGSGKSLCYQLPAYIYAQHHKCITLCISPLVSLMEDQVTGLPSFLKAVCLHTQQTPANRAKALAELRSGIVHILLVSPEAVVSSRGGGILGTLLKELPPIAFACLDEAHCLSEWSHNFRPSYLQLCKVLEEKLKVHTLLGLTATARNETALSIAKHLKITDVECGVISGTCIPDNLMLSVSRDEKREEALIHMLTGERFSSCSSIIVYCTRRDECERVATFIRTQLITASKVDVKSNSKRTRGISLDAEAYHAGLSAHRRQQIQKKFMSGQLRIVVATVAFGMGIDKSDVQGIVHFNMPRNLESYVQEIGRAGRDGRVAHCHLFLDSSDGRDIQELKRHIFANSVDRFTVRKLLNKLFVPCTCILKNNVEIGVSSSETMTNGKLATCQGHEMALPIESLIENLDIPEENILTLLCYLEINPKSGLKISHHAYATCNIACYKGPHQLCSISRSCPPLAAAIAVQRNLGMDFEKKNRITFPVVTIASQMGWDSRTVKQELKKLEWSTFKSMTSSSGVKVEFCDLSFHITCRGDLTEEEQDEMLEELYQRACKQEKDQLRQLQYTYDVLRSASHSSTLLCCDAIDEERSCQMKFAIRDYFSKSNESFDSIPVMEKLYIKPEIENRIRNDVRSFISTYSDQAWTGRSVARVMHGISSPNVPAKVWGKVRRFWRLHLDIDFNLLVSLSTKEILKFKGT